MSNIKLQSTECNANELILPAAKRCSPTETQHIASNICKAAFYCQRLMKFEFHSEIIEIMYSVPD